MGLDIKYMSIAVGKRTNRTDLSIIILCVTRSVGGTAVQPSGLSFGTRSLRVQSTTAWHGRAGSWRPLATATGAGSLTCQARPVASSTRMTQ